MGDGKASGLAVLAGYAIATAVITTSDGRVLVPYRRTQAGLPGVVSVSDDERATVRRFLGEIAAALPPHEIKRAAKAIAAAVRAQNGKEAEDVPSAPDEGMKGRKLRAVERTK